MQNKIVNMFRATLAVIVLTCLTALPATAQGCDWTEKYSVYWETMTLKQIQTCLANGTDVNTRGINGITALHFIAVFKNPEMITILIQAGANVHARDKDGYTPLHLAASANQNPEIITILINAGSDVNVQSHNKETPLHRAAIWNENPKVIMALLDAGADGKAITKDGKVPFDYAEENEHLKDTPAYWALNDARF